MLSRSRILFSACAAALLFFSAGSISRAFAGAPLQVHVTNVTNNSFVVSWVSTASETGSVNWGDSASSVVTKADDVRGDSVSSTIHYIVVSSASNLPNPTFFDVVSGGVVDSDGGQHHRVTPGPVPATNPPASAFGLVKNPNRTNVSEALIYYAIRDGNGTGSTGASEERSELLRTSDGGYWHVDLAALREASNLNNKFDYSDGDYLHVYAQVGKTQSAHQILDVAKVANGQRAPNMRVLNWTTSRQGSPALNGTWSLVTGRQNAVDGNLAKGMYASNSGNAVASLTCSSCSLFRWYTLRWARAGITQVNLDGSIFTVDNYDTGKQWQFVRSFFLAPGAHTITFTANGNKNPSATGALTVLDALEVW